MRPAAALLLPLALVACSGDPSPSSPDAGDAPLLAPPPAGQGRQLAMNVHIGAGEETQQCQYVTVDDAVEVARFEHAYTTGSHHLLLYLTDLDPATARTDLFECAHAQLQDLHVTGIAYAAQAPNGDLTYPDGVALKIPAHSVLLVQTHYLNASDNPLDAEVRLNLWYGTAPATEEAGTLFFYDWAILVPQGQAATARMRCVVPHDVDLIFGMSHMHKRGVGYQATLDGNTTLFETTRWEGIEPRHYNPVQHVSAGSVIDFHCDYQGDPDRTVIQGPSADANEMCMFVASYYPRLDQATDLCAGPGSGPVFSGANKCLDTVGCYRNATDPIAKQQCLADTCASSSQPADDLFVCMNFQCSAECAQLGSACDACVLDQCSTQYQACAQATCQ